MRFFASHTHTSGSKYKKKENINPFLYVLRMKALKSLAAVGLWGHTHTSLHTWVLCV